MAKEKIIEIQPKKGKLLRGIVFTLLLCFYASFLVHQIALPVGDDLPRLIRNGNDIVHGNYDVLTKNVYSYTEPEHKFANHHWLSGVVYYLVDETVGWSGQVVFKIMVLLTAFSILFWTAAKKADFWLVAALSIPAILILRERTFVRPEMFSYFLLAVYLYLLTDFAEHPEQKRIFWLIPLQLLWVNMHLFFGVGILMTAGFLVEAYRRYKKNPDPARKRVVKILAILVLALVGMSFLNPFGFKGALFALEINIGKDFPIRIVETRSYSEFLRQGPAWSDISVGFLVPMIIFGAISFLFNLSKRPIFYFAAFAGSAVLSLMLLRALPLFGMMFLAAVSFNLNDEWVAVKQWLADKRPKLRQIMGAMGIIGVMGGLVYLTLFDIPNGRAKYHNWGIGLTKNSIGAAEFFINNGLRGPIFNDTDPGSYLIYYLYPKERVFVDNRFGDAYSSTFFNIYLAALSREEKWKDLDAHLNFNSIFAYQYDKGENVHKFLYRRTNDPAWALVYGDNYNLIYLKRNQENDEIIKKYEITSDNVHEKLRHLIESPYVAEVIAAGDIMNLFGIEDQALEVFKRVVAKWPDQGPVWRVMGEITLLYISNPDPQLAVEYLQKALDAGEVTAVTYDLLGRAYYRSDQFEKAKESLEKGLEIDPNFQESKDLLEVVNGRLSGKSLERIEAEKWWKEQEKGGGE